MKFLLRCFASPLVLALCVVLSACGQKGKLVMPPTPTAISTPYPQAQPKPPKASSQSERPQTDSAVPEKN